MRFFALAAGLFFGLQAFAGLYEGEWYTDRDYGYAYGYDYYDYFGDYGYVGPGAVDWDAEWFPGRSHNYEDLGKLGSWFDAKGYATYEAALALAAKTAADMPGGMQTTVRGEVVEAGTTRVGVLKRPHVLVALRAERGNVVRVDLGLHRWLLAKQGVAKGQRIVVNGSIHGTPGTSVLMADSVELPDRVTVVIREPAPFRVEGRVMDWADLRAEKADEPHRAVLLDTAAGKLAVIVGPRELAEALDVRRGRYLLVEGRLDRVDGAAYVVAHRTRAEG